MFRSHRTSTSAVGLDREGSSSSPHFLGCRRWVLGQEESSLFHGLVLGKRRDNSLGHFSLSHVLPSAGPCVVLNSLWNSPFSHLCGCSWIYSLSQTCTYLFTHSTTNYLFIHLFIYPFSHLRVHTLLTCSINLYVLGIVEIKERGEWVQSLKSRTVRLGQGPGADPFPFPRAPPFWWWLSSSVLLKYRCLHESLEDLIKLKILVP